ncbi:MAG: hypothetical protein LBT00_05220 [Spirochaetaceae bacterium]|jgi:hypothetical protein|nr:hypothetical protein [Spirochaetaceae bacterium]
MSMEKVKEINRRFHELMLEDVKEGIFDEGAYFWHYEPFSAGYWDQKHKIVLCNLETHGESTTGSYEDRILTFEPFKTWVEHGYQTIKRSALFLYALCQKFQGNSLTNDQLRGMYRKNDELLRGIKNTAYMNWRKEEGEWVPENTENIYRFLVPGWSLSPDAEISNEKYRKLTLEYIDALEPDIFVVTGKTGWDVLKKIYEGKVNLPWQGMSRNGKTLFISAYHPSRAMSYQYILEKTSSIYKAFSGEKVHG